LLATVPEIVLSPNGIVVGKEEFPKTVEVVVELFEVLTTSKIVAAVYV